MNGRVDTVHFLLSIHWLQETRQTIQDSFEWAVRIGDIYLVEMIIKRYPNISKMYGYYTALACGHTEIVRFLEQYKSEEGSKHKYDSLFSAISNGHVESVRTLLNHHEIDYTISDHMPILISASKKDVRITKLILEKYSSEQLYALATYLLCDNMVNSDSGLDNLKYLLCFPNSIDRSFNPFVERVWKQMLEDEKVCIQQGRKVFREYGKEKSKQIFLHVPAILSTSTIPETDDIKLQRYMVEVQKFP